MRPRLFGHIGGTLYTADFKNNNYTTIANVDKTPDEKVRQLQRELNEAGYTDKFGQRLKEDGIYAGKTAYADDNYKADNPNVSKYSAVQNDKKFSVKDLSKDLSKEDIEKIGKYVYGNDYDPTVLALSFTDDGKVESYPTTVNASGPMAPIFDNVYDVLNSDSSMKLASVTGTGGKGVLESVDPKGNVRKYNEKIKENANMNNKPEWNIRRASNIISKNSEAIKTAGKKYGVNPSIIAVCIYMEQILNYNLKDVFGDKLYWKNPSVGIGQVQIATAQSLEDKGLVEKTKYLGKTQDWHANGYVEKDAWQIPGYGIFLGTKEEAIAKRLNIDEQCIEYVGAYLKLIQDLWKDAYPIIDGKSDILATLYNIGEYGGSRRINSSPEPNDFGKIAKKNYYHMQYLLGIE